MSFLLMYAAFFTVAVGSPYLNTTCADFQYDASCKVSSDNLEGEVGVDLIGDVPANCQTLCHSLDSCKWFNYFVGEKCQLLRFCEQFQDTPGAISGPTAPPIDSCSTPPFIKVRMITIDSCTLHPYITRQPLACVWTTLPLNVF